MEWHTIPLSRSQSAIPGTDLSVDSRQMAILQNRIYNSGIAMDMARPIYLTTARLTTTRHPTLRLTILQTRSQSSGYLLTLRQDPG